MEDTESTTTTETTQTTWDEVAAASADAAIHAAEATHPPRRFEQKLPCKLTDDELRGLGDTLEAALASVDTLTEEKKLSASGFKARIELAKERVGEIRESLRSKKEMRDVECCESFEYRLGVARVVRMDTGELVTERALSYAERQPSLPGVSSDDADTEDDAVASDDDGEAAASEDVFGDEDAPAIEDPQAVLDGEPAEVAAKKRARKVAKKVKS